MSGGIPYVISLKAVSSASSFSRSSAVGGKVPRSAPRACSAGVAILAAVVRICGCVVSVLCSSLRWDNEAGAGSKGSRKKEDDPGCVCESKADNEQRRKRSRSGLTISSALWVRHDGDTVIFGGESRIKIHVALRESLWHRQAIQRSKFVLGWANQVLGHFFWNWNWWYLGFRIWIWNWNWNWNWSHQFLNFWNWNRNWSELVPNPKFSDLKPNQMKYEKKKSNMSQTRNEKEDNNPRAFSDDTGNKLILCNFELTWRLGLFVWMDRFDPIQTSEFELISELNKPEDSFKYNKKLGDTKSSHD
ncbi:hypothetical protein LXL04_032029 [Taraxacum kok-saghyz]